MIAKTYTRTRYDHLIRFLRYRILHINDSPHRIALGVALGLFTAWTPLLGFHVLIVLGLAFLLKANKFAAVICVWANNPFTLVPIYYPSYLLGRTVLKCFHPNGAASKAEIQGLFSESDLSVIPSNFFAVEHWQNLFAFLWQKCPELWIGSLIIGFLVAFAGYLTTYYLIVQHQRRYPHRRFSKHR